MCYNLPDVYNTALECSKPPHAQHNLLHRYPEEDGSACMVMYSHQKHREIFQYPASDSHEGSKLMCMHGRVETLSSATIVALLRSLEKRQRMRRT
jgi:hypothetical protein